MRRALLGFLSLLAGCDTSARPARNAPLPAPVPEEHARFLRVRALLEKEPTSPERAVELTPLVLAICAEPDERRRFVASAAWSSARSDESYRLPEVLAAETLEYVATSCAKEAPKNALDLLDQAARALPNVLQIRVVRARLLAAHGQLEPAADAAAHAAESGSVHALALLANIEARIARERSPVYREGMFDRALQIVSLEPSEDWPLIDLTAVLSTRAHLYVERSLWEEEPRARASREEAAKAFDRLSRDPFIEATRVRALDVLCSFAAPHDAKPRSCDRAAEETGNLGAAVIAHRAVEGGRYDLARFAALESFRARSEALAAGRSVLLAVRGDETELVEWARPLAQLLAQVDRRRPAWIVLDRTRDARASRLVDRILEMAKVKPAARVRAPDALGAACAAALLTRRPAPSGCPIPEDTRARIAILSKGPLALGVLAGRSLEAEVEALREGGVETALLSFRAARLDKPIDAWFKSLSDVWIVARTPVP